VILLITYDLHGRRDYKPVTDLIETADHVHPMGSVWIIDTSKNCAYWRDALKKAGDQDDEFYVAELKKHWASSMVDKKTTDWLKDADRTWQ
jgi:hypothetical protein